MGLFTVRCVNAACGYRIRKGANFCPKCGTGAPTGRIRCGSCGREIRASSNFCPFCQAKTAVASPPQFTADRWARQPEDFAARIDVDDVRGWLIKPLVVEHGTRALLFQRGRFVGELPPGRYDMDGLLQRVTNFLISSGASIVIMDAGDVGLWLENGGLWTADEMEVGTTMQLIVRVQDADALFQNLIKGRGRLLIDDVETALADEMQMVLAGIVRRFAADQLFPALDARYEIETLLREHLRTTLSRLGLELVQLRFIDFVGEAYEELRQQRAALKVDAAKVDLRAQRNLLNQRLRELLTQDRMGAFKSEKDLEDFVRQTEHELGLKGVIRDDELQRLKERFQFERDREGVLRRLEIQSIENDELREQAWKQLVADERQRDERHRRQLERDLESARTSEEKAKIEARIDQIEHEQAMREAHDGLELLQKSKDIEQAERDRESQRKLKEMEAFGKADAQALLAILDGPAAERVLKLEKFRAQKDLAPEQLLAIAAEVSPEAARALAAKYTAEGHLSAELIRRLEQQLAEQRELAASYADRLERVMQTALQQMGQVATARAQSGEAQQTVVVPGGLGPPVVVNPPAPGPARTCRHCGAKLESTGDFCPGCGQRCVPP